MQGLVEHVAKAVSGLQQSIKSMLWQQPHCTPQLRPSRATEPRAQRVSALSGAVKYIRLQDITISCGGHYASFNSLKISFNLLMCRQKYYISTCCPDVDHPTTLPLTISCTGAALTDLLKEREEAFDTQFKSTFGSGAPGTPEGAELCISQTACDS